MDLSEQLQKLKDKYTKDCTIRDQIQNNITSYRSSIYFLDKEIENCTKSSVMLTDISLKAKQVVTKFLEDLVTDALQYISEGQYRFCIELESTEKSSKCEFYVVETIDGEESKQSPQDACGGGFIDIISTTLRYAYVNLYNDPKLMGCIILDEPGKMVSAEMSVRFGEFIKKLGQDFDRQTIMITHNDNLMNIADKVEEIVKV